MAKFQTDASPVSECEVGNNEVQHEPSLRVLSNLNQHFISKPNYCKTKQTCHKDGRDCHENQRFSRNDDAIKSSCHVVTKLAGAKLRRRYSVSAKEFKEADLKTVDIFASETVLASVAKQTSPKDGKDCRADKSACKDVVKHQLNTLATRKFAFTLAEVLITLVIIGIIAAVTVPTLMANYKKQEVSSRLKKFYSTLSQAVRLADIENPDFLRSTYSSRTSQNYGNWWNDNLGKYMPVEEKDNTTYKFSGSSGTITPSKLYILNDGSMFSLGWSGYYNSTEILYDINGEKAPNTGGKDVFRFEINDLRRSFNVNSTRKKLWICGGSYCTYSHKREALIQSCSANATSACSELLELDGWEIKDDYPLL